MRIFHFLQQTLKGLLKGSAQSPEFWPSALRARLEPCPSPQPLKQGLGTTSGNNISSSANLQLLHQPSLLPAEQQPLQFLAEYFKRGFFQPFVFPPPSCTAMRNVTDRTPKPEPVLWTHPHCWEPQKTLSPCLRGNGHKLLNIFGLV